MTPYSLRLPKPNLRGVDRGDLRSAGPLDISVAQCLANVVPFRGCTLLRDIPDTGWIYFARTHLRPMFTGLLYQPGYNKRVQAAWPADRRSDHPLTLDTESLNEVLRLLDSAQDPGETSRQTVKRSTQAEHSGYGYCAKPPILLCRKEPFITSSHSSL